MMSSPNQPPEMLQQQLDAITAQTRTLVQPERLAVADRAIAELLASGIADHVLPAGSLAPAFTLTNAVTGKPVRSEDLLAIGPLVVVFFRGRWCPYCMTSLEAWQAAYAGIRARGGLLVAISPQLPRQNDFTVQQHGLTFPLLSDPGCAVAARFGIAHTLPEFMQHHYRSILVNIPFVNGDSTWRLPLPATCVINREGRVTFSDAHADHRVRTEPNAVIEHLDAS